MTKQIYVKLLAKPNTWFKEGTEVYSYDSNPPVNLLRVTKEEWGGEIQSLQEVFVLKMGNGMESFVQKKNLNFLGMLKIK